ncbi:MAG TPA: zf-HC2 domain-containing protein [Propionibacteriaceae bacterium]|nr:zf-HC2 domain-containing protein [Propionibacteriaceae bacterium]
MTHPSPELLSAFVDRGLSPARHERVAAHLVGCELCHGEVLELRGLRSALGASQVATPAPGSLADSLVALAGRDMDAPLWLATGAPGARLPSRRVTLRRRAAVSSLVMACALVSVLALGLAMAPNLPSVADPVELAGKDLEAAGQWGGAGRAENLVASDVDRLATGVASASPMPVIDQGVAIDTDTALDLLSTGLAARTSYRGTIDVVLNDNDPCVHATVEVSESPTSGLSLVVRGANGSAEALVAGATALAFTSDADDLSFRLLASGVVAETPALAIEGRRPDGSLAERWWVNPQIGVLLARESWSASGKLLRSARFTQITYDTVIEGTAAPIAQRVYEAWCRDGFVCPETLAGLPRLSIAADSRYAPTLVRATYGDGRSTLTLVQQRGSLDKVVRNEKNAAWQSGTTVMAVTGTRGTLVSSAVNELPHIAPIDSTLGRAKAGLEHLTSGDR